MARGSPIAAQPPRETRRLARSAIPTNLVSRQDAMALYAVRKFVRSQHRRWVFRNALRRFAMNPERGVNDAALLADLIYGWGNEAWSGSEEYLHACVEAVCRSNGDILECGSGLSTILMGLVARESGHTVWSLEHHASWSERVRQTLERNLISSVRLCLGPLRDYGDYSWYDPPLDSMPARFAVVVCDGPPASTPGGSIWSFAGHEEPARSRLRCVARRRCERGGSSDRAALGTRVRGQMRDQGGEEPLCGTGTSLRSLAGRLSDTH